MRKPPIDFLGSGQILTLNKLTENSNATGRFKDDALYLWQLIQRRNILRLQHLLVCRQLRSNLRVDYMKTVLPS